MPARCFKWGGSLLWTALCLPVLGVVAGCGGSPEKVYPVEGVVTLDGTPLIAGTVVFEPFEAGQSGKKHQGRGTIGSDGRYRLGTFDPAGDGAVAGLHHVMIVPAWDLMGPNRPSWVKQVPRAVPEEYTTLETSPLQFEVQPGDNTYNIEIPSK